MSTYNSNHTGAQLDEALNKALNPDTTPSTGSSNLVTSGAVKDYVDGKTSTKLDTSLKGANNGLAELDSSGKVPTSQLPAYVDDVLEYTAKANFPTTGEAGKIYVDLTTNLTYRWSGSAYVEISPSLALGETSSTAYRGDRGKTAYDHSQLKDGTNPHATTFANIASKPTTIAGYGITDAKISSGTITLGSNTITPLTSSSTLDATKLSGTASINTTGKATTAGTADALKDVTATATELNILDGATLTTTELNYVDGVTSNIQTQLNNKLNTNGSGASLTALNATQLTTGTVPAARLPLVSTSDNGAMSSADKTKLNYTNVAYGTCSTEAATAAKVITVSGNTNWALTAGSRITIKFSATNTAQNPTFNVNNTGAKSVWYGTALITTSNLSYAGYANRPMDFVYDGTQYIFIGWSTDTNTTYSNASLGQGYGTCATAEATVEKAVTLSSYTLVTGGVVAVKFTYAVPASATMNINTRGAKAIYYKGAAITAGVIKAGDTATFIYNGTYYHLLGIDRTISGGSTSTSVNVSVATTAWAASTTYTGYGFAATVTASGVTASNNIIVGMSATATLAQEEACAAAGVQCKAQAANSITLYAKTKPTVALPITVMIM